jgi:hypothetical protein
MKYLNVGKNSKGFFLSHNEKILMEGMNLEQIQHVAPTLRKDGITVLIFNRDSLPTKMLQNSLLEKLEKNAA